MTNGTKNEFASRRIPAKTNFLLLGCSQPVSRMLATVLEWLTAFLTGVIMESRKAAGSKAVASPSPPPQIHRTIYNILLPPMGWHLITFHIPQRVYGGTEYADVTTKFSGMDSLPNFLTHGAPLARASRARALLKSLVSVFRRKSSLGAPDILLGFRSTFSINTF